MGPRYLKKSQQYDSIKGTQGRGGIIIEMICNFYLDVIFKSMTLLKGNWEHHHRVE